MNVNDVLVQRIASALTERKAYAATAESCTGGWIAKTMTDVPGSSDWFEYGFVTYSNGAKTDLLAVDAALLERHGAVSEPVAVAMAVGAARRANAQFSVAVTGIAGPGGGSAEKPVGTVWFAWVSPDEAPCTTHYVFDGDRDTVRRQAVMTALGGLAERAESSTYAGQ